MVIDTSAFIAILQGEPEQVFFVKAIDSMEIRVISAFTFVEAMM